MLEIKNLTKIYHTEEEGSLALKNISIAFPEKGFVAITGESGSGKTTLLNVLAGFQTYEEGDYFIDGVDFLSLSEEDVENYRKNDIGFVFQDYHLIETYTVLDNLISALLIVGVPYNEAKKKSLEYLKLFKLDEFAYNKARSISSGQKQKLAIARAMIKEPKIILCDEPTANLDPESGIDILSILGDYAKDHLVIISTHNYEDAKDYATHFIRLYNGDLTTYQVVKEIDDSPVVINEKKSTSARSLFGLSLKNQFGKLLSKVTFFSIFVAAFTMLMALFTANIDDSSTKLLSKDTFNNLTPEQLLVMRKDKERINEEELANVRSSNHVVGTQLYGLGTEMNYYYRKDIDYEYQIRITAQVKGPPDYPPDTVIEDTEEVFHTLREDMFIKSYLGFITEDDLKEGRLPTEHNEVVASGDYQIGDTIKVFFHEPVLQGAVYLNFDFTVVGVLKKNQDDLYFSDSFLKEMDYLEYNSNRYTLKIRINYNGYNKFSRQYESMNFSVSFYPIYYPSLGDDEIRFPSALFEGVTRPQNMPSVASFNFITATVGTQAETPVTLSEEYMTEDIPLNYLYVGKNIFHQYIDKYQSSVSRVYVDRYSSINDVIRSLTDKKYDTLSEYRASSTEYDPEKQNRRAIILIVSLSSIAIASLVYFIFGYLFEKNKLGDDKTLYLLGASPDSLNKVSFLQVFSANALGFIFGTLIYLVVSLLPIPFINDINHYLRFYHFLIALFIVLTIATFVWFKYHHKFLKSAKKGGN